MLKSYVCLIKSEGDSATPESSEGVAPSELFRSRLGIQFELADGLIQQHRIPIYSSLPHQQDLRNCFDVLAARITQHLSRDKQLVVIVDEVDLRRLNPLRNRGWESLIAMLIQAFPEVRWVFGKIKGCPSKTEIEELRQRWMEAAVGKKLPADIEELLCEPQVNSAMPRVNPLVPSCNLRKFWGEIRDSHSVRLLFESLGSPLFDDSGLRYWIRTIIRLDSLDDRRRRIALYLRKRKDLAVVLDEERDFRNLHGLMAYGRGLRVNAVDSWSGAKRFLASSQRDDEGSRTYDHVLTIEDVFLNYPDQTVTGMSDLGERDNKQHLPLLARFRHRRFVTVGHDQSGKQRRLEQQLRDQRLKHYGKYRLRLSHQLILKPAAGIYSLWNSMGLHRHLQEELREFNSKDYQSSRDTDDNHSSPGRLLEIAECLLSRAKRQRGDINSVSDAVLCAVLAIQAYELLGGLTPVLSLEALTLRHEFEVIAECQFTGVQHHLDVRSRLKHIQEQVKSISRYFGNTKKKERIAALNAELAIVGRLVDVLRKFDQFDEERFLLRRLRQIHRKLFFAKAPSIVKPLEVFPAYAERLVASFPLFVLAIFAWITAIGFAHSKLFPIDFGEGIAAAFMTFFGTGPSGGEQVWKSGDGWTLGFSLMSLTVLLGFVHLGLFVSYVYTIINRK